ncbi:MAG TPA: RIP metalloprotease RseP [Bdellovibrionales bacterium]|nr:RIP metalloprotease RseP [Bdellovibrionales bacterium]
MNIMTGLQSFASGIGPFFLLLGLLIFVHEMGHFLVAKFFKVRVETFSLGFGKKILSFKRGDTTYALSLIPLGGYVKMYGDDPTADIPESEKKYAFLHKPVWPRVAIVLAGPLMNLLFAVILFTMIGAIGVEMAGPFAGDIPENSKAYEAGFRSGDKILSINRQPTETWSQANKILEKSGGRAVQVTVERINEAQPLTFDVAVPFGENENIFSSERQVGQIPGLTQESRSTLVGVRDPQSPAAKAGIQSLDLLVAVDGQKVNYWRELQPMLFGSLQPGETEITLQVRDVQKPETAENLRSVQVAVPAGWNEKTDLADWLGLEPAELYIYQIKKDSPADKAGVQARDRVVRINNEDVHTWSDVLTRVKGFDSTSDGLDFTVLRAGQEVTVKLKPEMTELMTNKGQEEKRFTVGIVSGFFPAGPETTLYRVHGPLALFTHGVSETMKWTEFVVMSMVRLVQGDVSAKNIGGVITIGRVASHSFAAGMSAFLHTMAIISINLFLLNLLPIPILDGGHLVFYTIEGLRGAPLSMRKMELAQQIGLMLLMFLMVFAFFNDITNLLYNRW